MVQKEAAEPHQPLACSVHQLGSVGNATAFGCTVVSTMTREKSEGLAALVRVAVATSLLYQRDELLLAHPLAPARQRRAVERRLVLEELLAAEQLKYGFSTQRAHRVPHPSPTRPATPRTTLSQRALARNLPNISSSSRFFTPWGVGVARRRVPPISWPGELGADYVVTGNVKSGTGALRSAFQVNDVQSGARIWSQTLAPVLEDPKSGASEEELAGRAASLMKEAILVAENARAQSKDDGRRTAYDCVVIGFSVGPTTAAGARDCLEAAAQREPPNANVWMALANVVKQQRIWGWGLSAGEEASKSGTIWQTGSWRRPCAVDLAPRDAGAQAAWPTATTPSANRTASR